MMTRAEAERVWAHARTAIGKLVTPPTAPGPSLSGRSRRADANPARDAGDLLDELQSVSIILIYRVRRKGTLLSETHRAP